VLLGAKDDSPSRAHFHASRLKAHRYAIRAQSTFVGFVILFRDAWYVKRTTSNAVAAANAFILIEVDDAIGVLDDCTWTWARFEAAWVFTVHAAILTDQPFEVFIGGFVLGKAHHCP